MPKGHRHSDEVKAAVMAALLTGQSVTAVAQSYSIPRGTVGKWRLEIAPAIAQAEASTRVDIGELLRDYLCANLVTLKKQVEAFGDEEYIKKQHASEAAVLHGVIADKGIRLLEALSTVQEEPEDAEGTETPVDSV